MASSPKRPVSCRRVALYARVSTSDQDPGPQIDRLRQWAKASNLQVVGEYVEIASGRLVRRPEQDRVMAAARGHQVHAVAVAKLDRWGRSLIDLRRTIQVMADAGVAFYAVESGLSYERDTPAGTFFLNMLGACAEFEAGLISERTREGLAARKSAGVHLGRPLAPCSACGGARTIELRGKVQGRLVPLCIPCKTSRTATGKGGAEMGIAPSQERLA